MSSLTQGRTKIIATLGPSTDDPATLRKTLEAGVNLVRLNLSHGDQGIQRQRIESMREARSELGRDIGVLADLQGTKVRIGEFPEGHVSLEQGRSFVLDPDRARDAGDEEAVFISHGKIAKDVEPGDMLLLDDGLIGLRVEKTKGGKVHTTVTSGGVLGSRKGVNRQGGGFALGGLTDKDKKDIGFVAEMQVDYLAVSFVRDAKDIHAVKKLLRSAGSNARVIAKIERAEAVENLDEILEAGDGVMVARGDLGVEIGDAELPGLQKTIIRKAIVAYRPVITATQMMQSMVTSPIPTRAEVLDVANAVIDGTDAVMLSAETATGLYPAETVAAMERVCVAAERQFEPVETAMMDQTPMRRIDQAMARAAMSTAKRVGVAAIVALTESGATALWLSRFRSRLPVFGLTRHAAARRRMTLFRDVFPVAFDPASGDPAEVTREAVRTLVERELLDEGDLVLITMGDLTGVGGGTNTLKLLRVGD